MMTRAAVPNQTLSHNNIVALPKLYDETLAVSTRLSALEFDSPALIDGSHGGNADASTPLSRSREASTEASEDLQHFAATLQEKAFANAADTFRAIIPETNKIGIQADGYILVVYNYHTLYFYTS